MFCFVLFFCGGRFFSLGKQFKENRSNHCIITCAFFFFNFTANSPMDEWLVLNAVSDEYRNMNLNTAQGNFAVVIVSIYLCLMLFG